MDSSKCMFIRLTNMQIYVPMHISSYGYMLILCANIYVGRHICICAFVCVYIHIYTHYIYKPTRRSQISNLRNLTFLSLNTHQFLKVHWSWPNNYSDAPMEILICVFSWLIWLFLLLMTWSYHVAPKYIIYKLSPVDMDEYNKATAFNKAIV